MDVSVRSALDVTGPNPASEGGRNLGLEWLDRILGHLWWLGMGTLELVYRVDFVKGKVEKNDIDAPPLWVAATSSPDQNPVPAPGPLSLGTGGLLLGITKSATDKRAVISVGLSPKPPALRRFQMVANYSLPEGLAPFKPGNQWAATLIARTGGISQIPDNPIILGATHQVRGGVPTAYEVAVALGTAQGDSSSGPQIRGRRLVYPDGLPIEFQLQTDMDCVGGEGRSRMYTPYGRFSWRERAWTPPSGFDMGTDIAAIGVGIGFGETTSGRPAVLVKDFEIYRYVPPGPLLRAVAAAAHIGRRVLSVATRKRTDDESTT